MLICLNINLWIASQNITIDGSGTIDNSVIIPNYDSIHQVSINVDLLPLWYTTILELKVAEIKIDSLNLTYQVEKNRSKYLNTQLLTCKSGNDILKDMIMILEKKNVMIGVDSQAKDKEIKRLRIWSKIYISIAGLFALFAVIK